MVTNGRIQQCIAEPHLGGEISERTRSAILERIDRPGMSSPGKLAALVIGSPDFQRR